MHPIIRDRDVLNHKTCDTFEWFLVYLIGIVCLLAGITILICAWSFLQTGDWKTLTVANLVSLSFFKSALACAIKASALRKAKTLADIFSMFEKMFKPMPLTKLLVLFDALRNIRK